MSGMRVPGLATGMDIDSMVKELMQAEKMPMDKLEQDKTWLEWQQTDYREINKLLHDFRDSAFDLKLERGFNDKSVSSANEGVVTVKADSNAQVGNYELLVTQLAQGAFKTSSDAVGVNDPNQTLKEQFGLNDDKGSIVVGGETIEFDPATDTLNDIINKINSKAEKTHVVAGYNADNGKFYAYPIDKDGDFDDKVTSINISGADANGSALISELAKIDTGSKAGAIEIFNPEDVANEGTFKLNGVEISFNSVTDSIDSIVSKINKKQEETGVIATFDKNTKRFFLSTTSTGEDAKIEITVNSGTPEEQNNANELLKFLKLNDPIDPLYPRTTFSTVKGQDAMFTLNGSDFTMAENKFTINGLNYDLKGVSEAGKSTNITVSNDTEAVFDRIKDFVDSYNTLIEKINDKLSEKRYRDFPPLTAAQRKDMKENEIKLWDEKARSGTLKGDATLNSLLSNLRRSMGGAVDGSDINEDYNILSEIGIKTENWYEGGKLHLDEDKLKSALNDDLEAVKKLFTAKSDNPNEKGIATRLYDSVNNGITRMTDKAGMESTTKLVDDSYIGKRITDMKDDLEEWEDRLKEIEDRYWREFTAMEKAINTMNSQSAWLAQQFA